jgi:hypothetical protein
MAVKTTPVDSANELFDRLNDLRLARDWSYRQLANDIRRVTGFVVSAQTLQPVLTAAPDDRPKPYDRTVHKIRLYLAQIEQSTKPAKRRATA